MRWKPRGEWQPVIPQEPTPVAPTFRPSVPTWASRVLPLPTRTELDPALRRSSLAWKEMQALFPAHESAVEMGEE